MMAKPHLRLKASAAAVAGAAYHGGSTTARDVASWHAPRLSADAEILPNLGTLVGRTRDLDRNNGIAESGFRTVVDNVLGSGLRVTPRPDYYALGKSKTWADGWAREVRALWESYYWSTACHAGDSLTGDKVTELIANAEMLNGDGIGLPLWVPERGDGWSTKMDTVESDRLCNPNGEPPTRRLRGGIEFDAYGAPIAYHFRKTHPGDTMLDSSVDGMTWERVPRRTAFGRLRVIHFFDAKRSGQTRGKPMLSASLPTFKNLDRYQQAELQAAVVNAMIAAIIETPLDGEDVVAMFEKDRDYYMDQRRKHAVRLESGMMAALFPGDKLASFAPNRPAAAFDAFMTHLERFVGLSYDLPYELLMKDFSKLNYVTARAMRAEAWRSITRRRDRLVTGWLEPWYALWLEEAVSARKVEAPDFYAKRAAWQRVRVIGPGRGTLDPLKETQASQAAIDAGLSTLEHECGERGLDWNEVAEQRAAERARLADLGLPDHAAIRAANPIPPARERDADQDDDETNRPAPGRDPERVPG